MNRRLFPLSLLFFAAQFVMLLAQFVPIVNILMFVTVSVWPTLLINGGMIGIAFEAASGRIYRTWLLAPLIFYGLYYAETIPQHFSAMRYLETMNANNAKVAIPFDPRTEAVVTGGYVRTDMIVRDYALPVIYELASQRPEGHLAKRRLSEKDCAKLDALILEGQDDVRLEWSGREGEAADGPRKGGFCLFVMPEKPGRAFIKAVGMPSGGADDIPVHRLTMEIIRPDGNMFKIGGGTPRPLMWIPTPAIWCGPSLFDDEEVIHERPLCDVKLLYQGELEGWYTAKAETEMSRLLAKKLGLRKRQTDTLSDVESAELAKRIDVFQRGEIHARLARLDALIAGPDQFVDTDGLEALEAFPAKLAHRANGLMTALEKLSRQKGPSDSRLRALARLTAALPNPQFDSISHRVLAIYAKAGGDDRFWEQHELVGRIGILGTEALPLLTGEAAVEGLIYNHGVIEGLCRIGLPGKKSAMPVLMGAWKNGDPSGDPERSIAIYIALRRIGVTPSPLNIHDAGRLPQPLSRWERVSPTTPEAICSVASNLRRQREKLERVRRKTAHRRETDSRY